MKGCVSDIKSVGKVFLTFLLLINFVTAMRSQTRYQQPDFAFPQQVEKGSETLLATSLQEGNDLMALRAAINLCIARNELIDSESVRSNVLLMDTVSSSLHAEYKSLALLIEAKILQSLFQYNQYIYNNRNLPIQEPFPEDPNEWSADMFKSRILHLVEEATIALTAYSDVPLSRINLLLDNYEDAERMDFSISDFIAFNAVSLLNNFATPSSVKIIPFFPDKEKNTVESEATAKVKQLLQNLIDANFDKKSEIAALGVNTITDFLPDEERENYLKDQIQKFDGKTGQAQIIFNLWSRYPANDANQNKTIYALAEEYLKQFPDSYEAKLAKYVESAVSQKKISFVIPNVWLPDSALDIDVTLSNIRKGYILIYKLKPDQYNDYDNLIYKKFNDRQSPEKIIEVKGEGVIPYEVTTSFTLPALSPGLYVAIPSEKKTLPDKWNVDIYRGGHSVFRISDITIITSNDRATKDSGKIYVVDSRNQRPISGAEVSIYSNSSGKTKRILTTGKDGAVSVPSDYLRVVARYGKSLARQEAWFSSDRYRDSETRHISILTDLSIYRPEDTVSFVTLGWLQKKTGNSLIRNEEITVELKDANFSKIGNLAITLDNDGRGTGCFVIPKDLLLGTYHLMASFSDQETVSCGSAYIEVAEYKLPPFEVKINQEETSDNSYLLFKGYARTYSGLPISDANVRFKIDFSRWEWGLFRSNTSAIFHTIATTGSDGGFELKLPTEGLKGTVFEKGVYTLTAEVVSSTGEMGSSSPLIFYLGKANSIKPQIPDKVEIKEEKIDFHIPVYDIAGLPVKTQVFYKLINIDCNQDSIEGIFLSPTLSIDSRNIKSGKYRLEFKTEEDENWVKTETVLWRSTDDFVPYSTLLWIPENEIIYSQEDSNVKVRFGSYWEGWILCTISDENCLLEQKWIKSSGKLIDLEVEIPDGQKTYFVTLAALHDLEAMTGLITALPVKRTEKMTVEKLSFRENITAGTQEKWSFRFKVDKSDASGANAFAVMSDKALNALMDFKWNLGIYKQGVYSKVNIGIPYIGKYHVTGFLSPLISYPYGNYNLPEWSTYGYSWIYNGRYRNNGKILYKMAATRDLSFDEATEEESAVTTGMSRSSINDSAAALSESIVEEPQTNASETGDVTQDEKPEEIRPVEMPLAFFMPNLTSNDNGVVEVDFIVPDFNTTWQFQLMGYNDELLNASMVLDAVSAKEVMVKSNLPLYLHTGDHAQISALIFNNSSEILPLKGRIVVVNPLNDEILMDQKFDEESVEPSGSRLISLVFDVPENVDMIAVRSYGSSDSSTDGEQGFIPVYPSSTPIVEATTFYAKSSDEAIEISLPKFKKDANVTLKYCDNPLWEVLLSLPALRETNNGSVLSVVRNLYAVLMADDIIGSHPEIAQGLRNILSSNDSSLSMSNLGKDENLKTIALQATPWINNANSETARIRSLESYFDKDKVAGQIAQLKLTLKKLQNSDGGWSWFEGFKSSPFITSEVLSVLSYLSEVNLLDTELKSMAVKGVKYYDNYLIRLHKEKIDISGTTSLNYLYSRGLLSTSWKGEIAAIRDEALEKIKKDWRYGNLAYKSVAALVMLRNKSTQDEATLITESIKEFLNRQHPLYEEAWALILFNKVEPEGKTTEKLRELLYLQKETEDWGADAYTAGIIHALVVSSPDMVYNHSMPDIYAGGVKLVIPESQTLTGNFTIDIDAKTLSGKSLSIKRESGVPAWGGIISQYIAPMKDVKSESVQDLKIEKHIYLVSEDGRSREVSQLKKGDKIQVVINIDCRKDMDYVALIDQRAGCLLPVEQLSGMTFIDGTLAYREVRDNTTSFFIENMAAGKYVISYECNVERGGEYSLGIASVQSLYSPAQIAHSSGSVIKVE